VNTWKWLTITAGLALALLAAGAGSTGAYFGDQDASTSDGFSGWVSTLWRQTTQADFNAGVLNNTDTATSPGDARLVAGSGSVTDPFNDGTKTASNTNLVISGGQVKLSLVGPLTLRPNGNGNQFQLTRYPNTGEANWQNVDEVTSDENATYNLRTGGWGNDLYSMTDFAGTGTINSVTAWMRARSTATPSAANARQRIRTGGTNYTGTLFSTTTSYADYSYTWNLNPRTSAAWTWTDINALQAGVTIGQNASETRATQVWVVVDYTAYNSTGTLTSTNLLSGLGGTSSVSSFDYNASAIPSGTGLTAQFSRDNSTWYSSTGSAGGWDTLTQGTHTLSLSALGWSGSSFYYRVQFTSGGTATPVLDQIGINYSPYYGPGGTVSSGVLDTGVNGTKWNALCWSKTLPSNTSITFEARASNTVFAKNAVSPSWVAVGGASPVVSGLPSGRYMQWRATLATTDPSATPTLQEARVYFY
jgi:hypothetical protein